MKPLLFMRKKNLFGSFFGKYHDMFGLSRSVGTFHDISISLGLLFKAALLDNLIQNTGSGSYEFTSYDGDAIVKDEEGVLRRVPANCMRSEGARMCYNIIAHDLIDTMLVISGSIGNKVAAPNGKIEAYQAIANGSGLLMFYNSIPHPFLSNFDDALMGTIYLRSTSGSHTVGLMTGTFGLTNVTVTEEWQRFAGDVTLVTGANAYVGLNATGLPADHVLEVAWPQMELVTGKTDRRPQEYTSVGLPVDSTEAVLNTDLIGDIGEDIIQAGWTHDDVAGTLSKTSGNVAGVIWYDSVKLNRVYKVQYKLTAIGGSGSLRVRLGNTGYALNSILDVVHTDYLSCDSLDADSKFELYGDLLAIGTVDFLSIQELVDHGSGSDKVKFRNYTNPISIDAGRVITEGNSVPLQNVKGFIREDQSTNKCANASNINPVDFTGVTTLDLGTGATFTIVDDTAELLAAGLAEQCHGNVYRVTGGDTAALVTFNGQVGNTNPHTVSVWARGSGTNNRIGITGQVDEIISNTSSYQRFEAVRTPTASTNQMSVFVNAGNTLYFILNQLEEHGYATSEIPVAGASTQRNRESVNYAPENLNKERGAFYAEIEWIGFSAAGATIVSNNFGSLQLLIARTPSNRIQMLDAFDMTVESSVVPVVGTKHKVMVAWDEVLGEMKICVDGEDPVVGSAWNGWAAAFADISIGGTGQGDSYYLNNSQSFVIYPSDAKMKEMTS